MNRYSIIISLANGDRIEAKSVGENQGEALEKVTSSTQFADFASGTDIVNVDITFLETVTPIDASNYVLQKSTTDEGSWVVTDIRNNVVIRFTEKKYNETAHITPLYDFPQEPVGIATILREIGEYLATYHPELI